jgi:hypothetical protein
MSADPAHPFTRSGCKPCGGSPRRNAVHAGLRFGSRNAVLFALLPLLSATVLGGAAAQGESVGVSESQCNEIL